MPSSKAGKINLSPFRLHEDLIQAGGRAEPRSRNTSQRPESGQAIQPLPVKQTEWPTQGSELPFAQSMRIVVVHLEERLRVQHRKLQAHVSDPLTLRLADLGP